MELLSAPRAYSYIRFSTPEQLKGDSLRRQLDLSARYAKEHGLVLDEKLTFRDLGVSAFDKSNLGSGGKLRKFLDAVDGGHIPQGSFLLVESLDRLSRAEIREAFRVFTSILDKGITIVTLADEMTYSPSSDNPNKDFTSLVISLAIMSRAHEESLTKSKRLKAAWSAKRQSIGHHKLTGQCPAWLRLNQDRTQYEILPERASIIRQIIDLVKSGLGKGAIAKRFNEAGVPSIGSRGKDGTWFESYIAKILKNRALIGEFQPHRMERGKRSPTGETISNYFPQIISSEEFALLQDLISERGRKSGGNRGRTFANLFTGLAKCGYCGSSMVYVDKGIDKRRVGSSDGNRFLVCHKAKRGAGCYHVPWIYTDFENAFFSYAARVDFEQFVKSANDQATKLRSLNDQIVIERANRTDLVNRRDRLVDAIAGAEVEPKSIMDKIIVLEDQVNQCDERLKLLDNELHAITSRQQMSDSSLKALREVATSVRDKEGDERFLFRAKLNEYMRHMIDRIVLFPGGTIKTNAEIAQITNDMLASGRWSQQDIDIFSSVYLYSTPRKDERQFAIYSGGTATHVIPPESVVREALARLKGFPDVNPEAIQLAHQRYIMAGKLSN